MIKRSTRNYWFNFLIHVDPEIISFPWEILTVEYSAYSMHWSTVPFPDFRCYFHYCVRNDVITRRNENTYHIISNWDVEGITLCICVISTTTVPIGKVQSVESRILMILEALHELWRELLELCESVTPTTPMSLQRLSPSFIWFCCRAASALQAYPKGLSRAVLLTELETKWCVEFATPILPWSKMTSAFDLPIPPATIRVRRASLRRGEHAGRLRQAILSGLLQTTDIVVGEFFFRQF